MEYRSRIMGEYIVSGKDKNEEYIDAGALIGIKEYAYQSPPPFPYKIREVLSYARKKGVNPEELTKAELEQFRIKEQR